MGEGWNLRLSYMQVPHLILWTTPEKSPFFPPHFCTEEGKRRKVQLRSCIRQDESTVPNATGDAHTVSDRISPAAHLSHWSHRFSHCTHQVTRTINEVLKKSHIHRSENTGVYTLTSITSQTHVTWDLQNQERDSVMQIPVISVLLWYQKALFCSMDMQNWTQTKLIMTIKLWKRTGRKDHPYGISYQRKGLKEGFSWQQWMQTRRHQSGQAPCLRSPPPHRCCPLISTRGKKSRGGQQSFSLPHWAPGSCRAERRWLRTGWRWPPLPPGTGRGCTSAPWRCWSGSSAGGPGSPPGSGGHRWCGPRSAPWSRWITQKPAKPSRCPELLMSRWLTLGN